MSLSGSLAPNRDTAGSWAASAAGTMWQAVLAADGAYAFHWINGTFGEVGFTPVDPDVGYGVASVHFDLYWSNDIPVHAELRDGAGALLKSLASGLNPTPLDHAFARPVPKAYADDLRLRFVMDAGAGTGTTGPFGRLTLVTGSWTAGRMSAGSKILL